MRAGISPLNFPGEGVAVWYDSCMVIRQSIRELVSVECPASVVLFSTIPLEGYALKIVAIENHYQQATYDKIVVD